MGRPPSKAAKCGKELKFLIERGFHDSHDAYRYRRVYTALQRRGIEILPILLGKW